MGANQHIRGLPDRKRPLDQRILDHWLLDRVMGWLTVWFFAFGLIVIVGLLLVPLVILITVLT